jgi:hypothetical protein
LRESKDQKDGEGIPREMGKMNLIKGIGGVGRNPAVASPPCPSGHITADKKETKGFPKLPWATSFIRKTLGERAVASDTKEGGDEQ